MKEAFDNINTDLLVKYLLDEINPEEVKLVESWLASDVSNRRYYEHFKLIWEQSRELKIPRIINEDAAWQRFQNRIHSAPQNTVAKKSVIGNFGWMQLAAALILFIAGAWLAVKFTYDREIQTVVRQTKKETQADTLPDGSTIILNKNSLVRYPEKFTGSTRKISLEGEAFFNVSPNKDKPFIIQVNDVRVEVVGTSFNIKSINGNTEVIVETGVVRVIKNQHSISLNPREEITVHRTDSVLVKQPVEDKLYNYYRTKKFYCDNTPLWKLVQALNEGYGVNITIAKKELRALPLTTVFNDEPLDKILVIISETLNISVTRSGDQIVLQ